VQLTSFGGPLIMGPKWSPDGQEIAFFGDASGNNSIYVVSASRAVPRRMTTQPGDQQFPHWSRDGRWLYFVRHSGRGSGNEGIWKMPAQGGEAIQVTHLKEAPDVPQESPDGRFLYYCRGWPFPQTVWRIPIEAGEETKVIDFVHPQALWAVRQ